ncbi:MAG: HEAT repeat domain-containing protein [bacterium]|nr:HEAT repeat domain-containing protein [bacterium]MDD5354138.1 HEAT repeat domain-containing protein [bacterium]MDD5755947.1 HEAT repeat domain-containing protein [bacterium]
MSQPNKSPVPIELISDLLLNLQATLKSLRLYPLQHPLLVSSVDKLKQAINQFFTRVDTLRLRLKRQYIFVSGQPINKGDEVLETLSIQIYRLGIRELTFNQGLTDDELIKFLQFLNTDPAQILEKEGGESFWEAAQFTSIKINETLRQEIFRISEYGETREQKAGSSDNLSAVILLADFLGGQEKTPSREAFHLLGTLMSQPVRLAGMLQALARTEGSDPGGASEKEYIIKAFGKLISLVQQQPIDQQKNLYQQLAQCLGAFEPGIKKALLEHISADAKNDPAYSQVLAEIPAKVLGPLLQGQLDSGTSQAEIAALVNGLPLSTQGKSSLFRELKIADHLELAEKAMSPKPQQQVALSPAEITEIQYQVPPDINSILADLSHYTEQELNEIVKLSQINTPSEREEAFLQVMTELLRIEPNQEKNRDLAQTYENRVRIYLDNNIIDWAVKYLQVVRDLAEDPAISTESKKSARQLLLSLGTKEVVQKLVDTVKNIEKDDAVYVQIQKYLTLLPGDSTPFLIELLGAEEILAVRRLLCQVISEVSKDNLEYLWNRLTDPNWHLVRNIVLILGLINNDRSLSRLGDLLKHANARVRVEVIKSLGLSSNPSVFYYLLKGLKDKDEQVKIVAIEWLGNIQDQRAIPVLLQLVKKFDPFGWSLNLKREALESLGLLKAQEAGPFLEKLVQGRWVGFIGSRKTLLPEAGKALEQIKGKKKDDQ